MRLSFIPGDLYLVDDAEGTFTVTFRGEVILKTTARKAAVAKYESIRKDLESQFPQPELTPEEKADLFRKDVLDSMVGQNSLRPEPKKKPGKSRTFGD